MRGIFATIRPATGRILVNLQVAHGSFYNASSLSELMDCYLPDLRRLDMLVRLLRVEAVHLEDRRGDGKKCYKTIKGLARASDAQDSGGTVRFPPWTNEAGSIQPPKEFGAGPHQVEFKQFVEAKQGKQGKQGKRKSTSNDNKLSSWLTVEQHYEQSRQHPDPSYS
jgi:hypothetical protein